MSLIRESNRCRIPLDKYRIEGIEDDFLEDLKYRPNRYFHPVESLSLDENYLTITYQRPISPLERKKVSLQQINQLLEAVIDGYDKLPPNQVFYLYPGLEAFGEDSRGNIRICLINVCPNTARELSPQEKSVQAFKELISLNSELSRKFGSKIESARTLRQLKEILNRTRGAAFYLSFAALSAGVVLAALFLLYNWGPPKVRQFLRASLKRTIYFSKRIMRSGSAEWFAQLRAERHKWEYKFEPAESYVLIRLETENPIKLRRLYQQLQKSLEWEFEDQPNTSYQVLVPHPELFPEDFQKKIPLPSRFPKLLEKWKELCKTLLNKECPKNTWLLYLKSYRGGFRPLQSALEEQRKFRPKSFFSKLRYHSFFAGAVLSISKEKSEKRDGGVDGKGGGGGNLSGGSAEKSTTSSQRGNAGESDKKPKREGNSEGEGKKDEKKNR